MIKKIGIKKIEKVIGKHIKKNLISIGFDVSQHSTGVATIRTTEKFVVLEELKTITVPKKTPVLDTIDLFLSQLDEYKQEVARKYKCDIGVIEDCFFGSNIKTLKTLARFRILVYDRFRRITKKMELMLPMSARKAINFKKSSKEIKGPKLKKEIIAYVCGMFEMEIESDDEADALVLALAGVVGADIGKHKEIL